MLVDFFISTLKNVDFYTKRNNFQQDGDTSHTPKMSMNKVRSIFPVKVISRFGELPWSPRSPDLTPCDFIL